MMKRFSLHIMKWFLPILFISYVASITLFTHAHVVNGVTIVHSHPFKKGGGHTHTAAELQLIHHLSYVVTTDSGVFSLLFSFVALLLGILLRRPQCISHSIFYRRALSLRAPPSVRFL